MDNSQFDKLIGYQIAEFDKASKLQRWVGYIQAFLLAVTCSTLFVLNEAALYSLALASLLVTLLWEYLDYKQRSVRSVAEKARRATLFMGALGFTLSEYEFRELQLEFDTPEPQAEKRQDSTYFSVQRPYGIDRLAEMLEEAAFWSGHLLRASARRYWAFTIGAGSISILLLITLVPFIPKPAISLMGKALCAVFTVLLSLDVLGRAVAYSDAAESVKCIQMRIEAFKASGGKELGQVLIITADYNSAVEGAPLFVSGIYQKNKDRLNALWKSTH